MILVPIVGKVNVALQALTQLIEGGAYTQGDKLPSERQLAVNLKLSRRALQQAFHVLEAEGKVWRSVGRGTFVGQRTIETPRDLLAIGKLTSPTEVMEVRLLLEPHIAHLAAQRAAQQDLLEMKSCLDKGEQSKDFKTYELWDERFHRAIAVSTHNNLLVALHEAINAVRTQTAWGEARQKVLTISRLRIQRSQHRAIYSAVENRDTTLAKQLMAQHIRTVRGFLLEGSDE
jgi:DNA-binding FadR family transcriptional regulator